MTILDRYIARQYLINTLLLLVLLFSFVVMVDVSINLSRFLRTAGDMVGTEGGQDPVRRAIVAVLLVVYLWGPRLLQLYNYVLGLVLIGAMGFTFSQLVRSREIVAMLAGGVSLWRVARPVVVVAVLLCGLQVLNQELLIPRIAHLLTRDAGSRGDRQVDAFPVRLTVDGGGRIIQAQRFRPATSSLEQVNIWERSAQGRVTRRISADSAVYEPAVGAAGGAWRLVNPRVTPFAFINPQAAGAQGGAGGAGGAGGLSAAELEVLRTPPTRLVTDLSPTTLLVNQFKTISQALSWGQIMQVLTTPGVRAETSERLLRIGLGRVSGIICTLLSLAIAMPFFLTREPKNMVLQSLKCAPVAIVTSLGAVLAAALPIPGLPAAAAAFIPVAILAPLAIAAATSIKS